MGAGLAVFHSSVKALWKHSSRARCLNGVIYIQIWLLCLCVAACWFTVDVPSGFSLQKGRWCSTGAGVAVFHRTVKALWKHSSMARCLNGVIYIQFWLLYLCVAACWFTVGCSKCVALQGVGGVAWVLGLLCFIGMSEHGENILAGLDAWTVWSTYRFGCFACACCLLIHCRMF